MTIKHPSQTTDFFGHRDAENTLLTAFRSGRMPHAWLIGGPHGIGKATLAYRTARFALGHPDASSPDLAATGSLAVAPDGLVARQVMAGAHPGLLSLQIGLNDAGKPRTVITVDQVRETVGFFGSTAAAGGWRVCIVDAMDDLNANGANALLKILEEPPPRSLFLLVSHAPARLLPTILSRCRRLDLRPLATGDVKSAMRTASDEEGDVSAMQAAADIADGSVARAFTLLDDKALKLGRRVAAMLDALPAVDGEALHAIGDLMPLNDRAAMAAFVGGIERFIERRVGDAARGPAPDLARLARLAEVWDKTGRAARDAEAYNLERKPLVFSVVGWLAEAVA